MPKRSFKTLNLLFLSILALLLLSEVRGIVDRTYFTYLGLTIEATDQQIKEAYRTKKAKLEALTEEEQKTKKLGLLNQAYETLTDNKLRERYERYGKANFKNIKEITSINKWSRTDTRKDPTLKLELPVSIEDIFAGANITAMFMKTVACDVCKGTGAESMKSLHRCDRCAGKGFNLIENRNMYGEMFKMQGICPACRGHGNTVKKSCPKCGGARIKQELTQVKIPIPQGLPDGNKIKIPNFGPEKEIGAPSDLEVNIVEIPTDDWSRNGMNSIYTLDISLEEALFGFTNKEFKNLDGEVLKVSMPQMVKKQSKIVLQQKGILNPKTGKRGNLTVQFRINIPKFNDEQLDAWEDFFRRHKF